MSSLGSLVVSLALDTARWTSDIGRSAQQLARLGENAAKMGAAVAASATLAATATAAMVKRAIDAADAAGKQAQAVGMSVESYTALAYAGRLAGVEQEALSTTLVKFAKNAVDAADGTGEAADAFKAMGVSVKNNDGTLKSQQQLLGEVADKFASYRESAEKTALATQVFGKSGAQLLPLLNGGSTGLAEMAAEADKLGVTIGGDVAKNAEAFNDNLSRLDAVREGLVNGIARQLLPTLSNLSAQVVDTAKNTGALETAARAGATGVKLLISAGTIVVGVLDTLGTMIGGVGAGLVALFSGNFREAFEIARNVGADFVGSTQRYAAAVESIWDESAARAEAKAPSTGGSLAAPMAAATKKVKQEIDKQRKLYEDAQRQIQALKDQVDQFGASDKTKGIIQFSRVAQSGEQLQRYVDEANALEKLQQAADRAAKAEQARRELLAEGVQVYEATRTSAERYAEQLDNLAFLLAEGAIGQDTFNRAMSQMATDQAAARQSMLDNLSAGLLSEEEEIQRSYDRRREAILAATEITELERQELLARLDEQAMRQRQEREAASNMATLGSAQQAFAGLAQLAKANRGEQSRAYKALFAVQKAFAIAQATLSLNQAIALAAASAPFPANLGAMAAVASAVTGLISSIMSTNFAGAFDKGGNIPAGQWGIAGEFGPEIIEGPARVTSRAETKRMLESSQASASGERPMRVIVAFGEDQLADALAGAAGERVIVHHVRNNREALAAV
jgi:hypothetical protein